MFQVDTQTTASFLIKPQKRRHASLKYVTPANVKMEVIFGILNTRRCVWRRNETHCQEVGERWSYIQELDKKIPQNQYAIILHRPLGLCIGRFASKIILSCYILRFVTGA